MSDMHLIQFARSAALILSKERRKKAPTPVLSFWDVNATRNVDLPRTYNKALQLRSVPPEKKDQHTAYPSSTFLTLPRFHFFPWLRFLSRKLHHPTLLIILGQADRIDAAIFAPSIQALVLDANLSHQYLRTQARFGGMGNDCSSSIRQ